MKIYISAMLLSWILYERMWFSFECGFLPSLSLAGVTSFKIALNMLSSSTNCWSVTILHRKCHSQPLPCKQMRENHIQRLVSYPMMMSKIYSLAIIPQRTPNTIPEPTNRTTSSLKRRRSRHHKESSQRCWTYSKSRWEITILSSRYIF